MLISKKVTKQHPKCYDMCQILIIHRIGTCLYILIRKRMGSSMSMQREDYLFTM
jgi:hypothetical protein